MNFSKEDMAVLQTWEPHFKTMIESGFCRNLRDGDIRILDEIWNRNTGDNHRTNKNCGACIGDLVRMIAPKYYADKQETAVESARTPKTRKSSK